jgi:hypothetical protein
MSRRPFIAGNWKMNLGPEAARDLASGLRQALADDTGVDVLVAPPAISIPAVVERLKHTGILVAGQDLHPADSGAFTSQLSGSMLKEAGCEHVLVGHSERCKGPFRIQGRITPNPVHWRDIASARIRRRCGHRDPAAGSRAGGIGARPGGLHHHRLRTHLGDRHRCDSKSRASARYARSHPIMAGRALSSFCAQADSNSIRRQRQTWQRRRTPQSTRYRWRPRGRRISGGRQLCCNRPRWNLKG